MTELPATSTVQSVTLYREGALVTRAADVQLDGAGAEVLIGGLPLTLQDGSLRFEIEGEGDDLPLAVDATVELAVGDDGEAQEPAIDAALDAARLHRAKQKTLVEQLRTELAQVTELGVEERPEPEEGQPPPDSPTDARIALLEFRRAQAQRLALSEQRAMPHRLPIMLYAPAAEDALSTAVVDAVEEGARGFGAERAVHVHHHFGVRIGGDELGPIRGDISPETKAGRLEGGDCHLASLQVIARTLVRRIRTRKPNHRSRRRWAPQP